MEIAKNLLVTLSSYSNLILPICSLVLIIIPRFRKWIVKTLKKSLGIDAINTNMQLMSQQLNQLQLSNENQQKLNEVQYKNQIATTKDNLLKAFYFYIDRKYITLEELDVLQELYSSYIELGGNGIIKQTWENEIVPLPKRSRN